ncbi:MAG TPA: efflux RND transporter periplasmic adaptor subunit [Thermoanaerobaculia bacterium]|nr:efflux RND transporter periplasmic adaptor subunit [Thermoanaerobaculia bacterium]
MKRILGFLTLASLVAGGCAKKEGAPAASVPRALGTATVERRVAPGAVEVDGIVVGRSEAVLASRLAAAVAEVHAVPGQAVRAGEVLVRLEQREADGAVESARAAVASAESALGLARKNLSRFERLEGRGAAAAVELERSRQDEASATAALAAAEAGLRRAETDRAQAVLIAPFDAVVVEKLVSPGDLAAPGRPLVRLASAAGRRVETAPGEERAAQLSVGDAVQVELGGRTVDGRIGEIVGAVDPVTRRRTVRVDLPGGAEPAIGAFARVRLPGPPEPRLFAPARAVVPRGGLELAWAVGPGGIVALRYVRTGPPEAGGLVEIRSGLEAGERVVVDPPADLEAGTRIAS